MNDHPKHNPRLRQTVIVAVCVLAVLLFLYLLLRDRPGSASDYLDDSAPYTFDSSASRTFRTVDSRLAVVSSSGLQLLDENGKTVLHEIFTLSQPGISVGGEASTSSAMAEMMARWAAARLKSPEETAWRSRAKARASSPFSVWVPAASVMPLVSEVKPSGTSTVTPPRRSTSSTSCSKRSST